MSTSKNRDKEQKQIVQIYAAFGAAIILSLMPFMSAALLSAIIGLGVLISAYIIRTKKEQGSLSENHMTFIIRTLWIGSFIALIVMIAGSIYLYLNLDNSPLDACLNRFVAMGDDVYNIDVLKAVFRPCQDLYLATNLKNIMISGSIIIVPTLGYLGLRFGRGLARAMKGHRVSDPKAWL